MYSTTCTFNEVIAVSILGNFKCWSLLPFGWWFGEKVVDELVVDLSKGNPQGELLVLCTVQLNRGVIVKKLSKTSTCKMGEFNDE